MSTAAPENKLRMVDVEATLVVEEPPVGFTCLYEWTMSATIITLPPGNAQMQVWLTRAQAAEVRDQLDKFLKEIAS